MSEKTPVIVLNSWGNYHVFPADIDYARNLLKEKINDVGESNVAGIEILNSRKRLSAHPEDLGIPYLVSDKIVLRAMSDILEFDIGKNSRSLCLLSKIENLDDCSNSPVTKAIRDELILWSFDHKFDCKKSSATELNKSSPEKTLSFMSGLVSRSNGHPVKYVDEYAMDECIELNQLLFGKWKPNANVANVVQQYLNIINNYCHRDERYHIGTMESH